MLAPVAFFAVVIAVVAPENYDRVVRVGAAIQGVQYTADKSVGIADASEVAVDGVVDSVDALKSRVYTRSVCFDFPNTIGQVVEIVALVGRQFNFGGIVEIEVLFGAVVRKVLRSLQHPPNTPNTRSEGAHV